MKPRGQKFSDQIVGIEDRTELLLRFAAWALALRRPPTARQIRNRWGMHKATANRYRSALLNSGLLPEEAP